MFNVTELEKVCRKKFEVNAKTFYFPGVFLKYFLRKSSDESLEKCFSKKILEESLKECMESLWQTPRKNTMSNV